MASTDPTSSHGPGGNPTASSDVTKQPSTIPSYAFEYAPLVWLCAKEDYLPADIGSQLTHTIPEVGGVAVKNVPAPLTLDNLNELNSVGNGGVNVSLTSKEGIEKNPSWFRGILPDSNHKVNGGTSCAIIIVDKGSGKVDVFYQYFYAYNQGNIVVGIEFGDHVGDWEHNMIRFQDGVPQAVWYSQHSNGEAFTYAAVEKKGVRPISYAARGSHANYAIPGSHDHAIPDLNQQHGLVEDHCDAGTLYDPTLSAYTVSFDLASQKFTAYDGSTPVNWLYFKGAWGDAQVPDNKRGQKDVFGQRKYVGGPTGPLFKHMDRKNVCFKESGCTIRTHRGV